MWMIGAAIYVLCF